MRMPLRHDEEPAPGAHEIAFVDQTLEGEVQRRPGRTKPFVLEKVLGGEDGPGGPMGDLLAQQRGRAATSGRVLSHVRKSQQFSYIFYHRLLIAGNR